MIASISNRRSQATAQSTTPALRAGASVINPKFGPYGGQFVPETLMPALGELEAAYVEAMGDAAFVAEYERLLRTYVGRPTALTHARRMSEHLGGAQIYLKREDLAHSGFGDGGGFAGA